MPDHPFGIARRSAQGAPCAIVAVVLAAATIIVPGLPILPAAGALPSPAASAAVAASDLDWTIGAWKGTRRDGADDSEAPMTMRVEAILGGAGQIHHIEIPHDGGVYRGFAVQVFDGKSGRWVQQYTNAGRGAFSTLEGEVEGDRSTWRVTSPDRTRDSRLVSERLEGDRWRRTMSISTDGGRTWSLLWRDELRRAETP